MNNTSRVTTLPSTWESKLLEENKYLKEFIGGVSIDEIKRLQGLEKENTSLKAENKALRDAEDKIASAHEETVKAIKAEAAARIEAANKAHADGSSRQRGVWESQVSELRFQNNKLAAEKLAASKEVDNLKSEVSRLKSEVKSKEIRIELLGEMNSKLDQILEIVRGLAESGASPQQIVEKIDEVKNTTSRMEKVRALIYWEEQGLSSAKDLLPHLEAVGIKHASRISELRGSKEYKILKGGVNDVEA